MRLAKFTLQKPEHLKRRILTAFTIALLLFSLFVWVVIKINTFFDSYALFFQAPIIVKTQVPIVIQPREKTISYVVKFASSLPRPQTPIEDYICQKFGSDCQVALAVMRAESGGNEEAINVNTNGTIDFGCWQVNSIHLKKGVKIKDLLDCRKATDWVYENLYKQQGFAPWVTYTTGRFVKGL